ncbi:hypothetical protein ES692_17615 [Psychroserpens burtonensis]|uniref:Uncharacterized protein n=1 Tax=Psychroserpens burtonensis TaxID=49278 RepID=A0A5C7B8S1_9FLAO|nr:STM3941 family protein [Psychroserpens burtonensis]TXE14915.1 hypothetical protein ES692_17615 [Psychroserpens burtonensis]
MNKEIIIPLSKTKILLLFIGAMAFVIFGIWFLNDPEKFANTSYRPRSSDFIQIVGIVAVIFFGICGMFAFKKLFDKKNGLVINDKGIIDNSSGTSVGLIKWSDIIGIGIAQVHSQKFIMLEVSNPEYYIGLKKNKIGKMAMRANYDKYGSPISISANSLKTNFTELQSMIEKKFENYNAEKTHHNNGNRCTTL